MSKCTHNINENEMINKNEEVKDLFNSWFEVILLQALPILFINKIEIDCQIMLFNSIFNYENKLNNILTH